MKPAAFALAFLIAASASAAEPVRVIDGDGFELAGEKIRLWGIDAPELRQECSKDGVRYACGRIARDNLELLTTGREIVCEAQGRPDRYGRTVASCTADGEDVAGWMVRHGWALDWPRYSGGAYAADQDGAEANKRGLWAGFFAVPWEWRNGPKP